MASTKSPDRSREVPLGGKRTGRKKRRPGLPSLPGLIEETRKLRIELEKLMKRFPVDAQDPEGPVFPC